MSQLALTNVINISVSQAPAGIGEYNTSNLALFSRDLLDPSTFGTLGFKIYTGPTEVGTDFGTDSTTYKMANAVFSQKPNILAGGGKLIVIPFLPGNEELGAAITRTKDLVQYFGVMQAEIDSQAYTLAAAAVVQALNKIAFFASCASLDIAPAGTFDLFRTTGYTQSRGLIRIGGDLQSAADILAALLFQAGYASRALSVNFDGNNTTITMNMKDLAGVAVDTGMTETYFNQCKDCGADGYASFQGVPKVFSNGANRFYDQVYNQQWFVGALQVAGFNFLARASTKVPQTEDGMTAFKGAYRKVCDQAVTNQYAAPGEWDLPDTFGDLNTFLQNISQRGYYIFSQPISQQAVAARDDREAPLVQIALKEAGAIHSSSVLVNINA